MLGERFLFVIIFFFILVYNHSDVICCFDEIYLLTLPGFLCKTNVKKVGMAGWLLKIKTSKQDIHPHSVAIIRARVQAGHNIETFLLISV